MASVEAAAGLARALPRGAADPACRLAGRVWYLAATGARGAVRANLRQVLGREPTEREVRAVFEYGALNYWDTFAIPHLDDESIRRLVDVEGWEHLEQALRAGRGAILAGAHLGSVALAGQVVAARGYPVVGVVERIEPPELFDLLTRLRSRPRTRLLPVGPSAARELLGALRRNEVVGLVTDRDVLGTGLDVEFFGAPATFPDGAAALALRTGAPILPAVAVRLPSGRFRGWIDAPLARPTAGTPREQIRALTQSLATRLEYHIRRHPEQWTVFQRRW